jgi:hypothetical protein
MMSCDDELDDVAFDARITAQLAQAADDYASLVDLSERLAMIREVGTSN